MIVTTHIKDMLRDAIRACEAAEELAREKLQLRRNLAEYKELTEEHRGVEFPDFDPHQARSRIGEIDWNVRRLLTGAKVNAQHAGSDIADEKFRFQYPKDGYAP